MRKGVATIKGEEAGPLLDMSWKSGKSELGVMRLNNMWRSFLTRKIAGPAPMLREQMGKAISIPAAEVVELVDATVRGILGMSNSDELDETAPLTDLGFDSMLSVELR